MTESIKRRIIWKETEEDTFVRFSQYLYTGSYDEAKPSKRVVSKSDEIIAAGEVAFGETWLASTTKKKKKKNESLPTPWGFDNGTAHMKTNSLWAKFKALHPDSPVHDELEPVPNVPSDDYSEVFLCHARLYVLADCYGIDMLRTITLRRLRQVLVQFELHMHGSDDITQLVTYCLDQDRGDQGDALGSLVCLYSACKAEELWKNADFRAVLGTSPEFSEGFIASILKRL